MNTEAIRKAFETEHGHSSFDWDSDKNRYKLNHVSYNHDPSEIELEYNSNFELYKDGYQKAVKDMEYENAELTKERDELKAISIFMCKTWTDIHSFVFEYCKDSITHYPMIQGTSNQFALEWLGKQKLDKEMLHSSMCRIKKLRAEDLSAQKIVMDKTWEEYEKWCNTREFDNAVIYTEIDIDKAFLLVWKAATEAKSSER